MKRKKQKTHQIVTKRTAQSLRRMAEAEGDDDAEAFWRDCLCAMREQGVGGLKIPIEALP